MAKETTNKTTNKKSADKKAAAEKASAKVKTTKKPVAAKAATSKVIKETEVESKIAKASVAVKKPAEDSKAAVKAAKIAKAKEAANTPAGKLAKWHRWLGIFFLLQGLAVLLLGRNVTAPVTMQYPSVDTLASEATGREVIGLANRHIADVHVEWVLATTLIVFAAVHFVSATAYRPYVDAALKRGVNAFRWLALGIGGGLLTVAVAMISGFSSLPLLLVLFGTVAGAALLAHGVEVIVANNNGVKGRLARFLCGLASIGALVPWIILGLGVVGAALWKGELPAYLYSLYLCGVLLAGAFMLATHFHLKRRGKWADNFYTERGYLLLTLITVTLLTWQIVAGALK